MKSLRLGMMLTLMAMLPLLEACGARPALPSPLIPTVPTPSAVLTREQPTATPIPTPTPSPLPSPTLTPVSVPVWRFVFAGAPCSELDMDCMPSPGFPLSYYLINSDGSGLEKMEEPPPPVVPPPGKAPPHLIFYEPQLSPDGSYMAYIAKDGDLYIADMKSGEARRIFTYTWDLGPVCWTADGMAVRFIVPSRDPNGNPINTFFQIDRDGRNLQQLFTISDLGNFIGTGVCSPDGRELVFSFRWGGELYIVNLESGEWRKILPDYGVFGVLSIKAGLKER